MNLKMPLKKTDNKLKTSSQKISRRQSSSISLSAAKNGNYLSSKSLQIGKSIAEIAHDSAPPSSPRELVPNVLVTPIPNKFPALKHAKLPVVREVGVREAIRILSEIFECTEYELNLIQFWFLDIIADCVWRAQDEFRFPDSHQKIVLEWILFTFDLIRAQHLNLSRKKLFAMFAEALSIASDYVEAGCPTVPLPEDIFSIRLDGSLGESSESSTTSECSGSVNYRKDGSPTGSLLAIKFQDNAKYFKLPGKTCAWDIDDECLSSSVESLSEDERPEATKGPRVSSSETETNDDSLDEEIEFYKPDLRTPPRFQGSDMDESSSISSDSLIGEENTEEETREASWKVTKRHFPIAPCSSEIFDIENKDHETTDKELEDKTFQAWFDYHLWQIRKDRMNNSVAGFSETENLQNDEHDGDNKFCKIQEVMQHFLENDDKDAENLKKNVFVNTCVLLAIKKFVFDYFYESFQFSLVKMAYRYPQFLITQDLNKKWFVPKTFKSELKKPQPRKPKVKKSEKKEKPPKRKKEKSPKSPKKEKKDKRSAKSEKASKKSEIDDKKSKKKGKKDAAAKAVSRAEIAEEARRRKEEEELEKQRRQDEENKRFMFPLNDAATEDFFQGIFENWVKPKGKRTTSKDKKSKADKHSEKGRGSKKGKSSKKDVSEGKSDAKKKNKGNKGHKK